MGAGRMIRAALLSFASACALPWMLKSGAGALWFTNSIFSVFVFAAFLVLFYRILGTDFQGGWKRWVLPGIFGFGFSLSMVFGKCLDEKGSVPFENGGMWAAILALSIVFAILVRFFWDKLACLLKRREEKGCEKAQEDKQKSCLFYGGLIFLCYLPVFLAVYPGFFVYDAQDELMQVVTRNFTTHHPLFHVLLLGGIIQLVHKLTGSYNLGIACYTLVQMAVMAGIFGWCVGNLRKRGIKRGFCLLFALYFGICPVLVMFSLCSAKDGLFAGMLLVMTLLLSGLIRSPEDFFAKRKNPLLLGIFSLLMMLLRHNGMYAFLASSLCILFYIGRREKAYFRKILLVFAITFGGYLAAHNGISGVLSADASENQEILTVPIQQVARVYQAKQKEYGDQGKKLDLDILYRYLPPEALSHYNPKVSDGVKVQFNNQAFKQDKGSFFKLWLKWGVENPFTYCNAWFMTSYGYWYPDTVIDVYRGNTVFTYTYEDSSYFGYEVEEPGIRESKIPWLSELYRRMSLEVFQQRVPVVSMAFSPGFLFWVWAFCLCFWWYQGLYGRVVPYLPVVFCFLTVLLGPTYLVRYVVYLWAALPVLLAEFDNLW